jgi:hypothetical protein
MLMTTPLLINVFISIGLGGWFTGLGFGGRAFLGWALAPVLLYAGGAIFGLALSLVYWVVIALAMGGVIRCAIIYRTNTLSRPFSNLIYVLQHPVIALSAILAIVISMAGPTMYTPLEWDELTNWLHVPHQMFAADAVWHPDMRFSNPGYTPGWYMALLLGNMPYREFQDVRTLTAGIAGMIMTTGLIYDVILLFLNRIRSFWPPT